VRLFLTQALSLPDKLQAAGLLRKLGSRSFAPAPELTVKQWLDQESLRPNVRGLAEMLIRLSTYSNDMAALSAAAAVAQVQLGIHSGVLYLDGGWETLIEGLQAKAQAMGVIIEAGQSADSVEPGTIWPYRRKKWNG
jgi:phytoene dehydrogenase-like protein